MPPASSDLQHPVHVVVLAAGKGSRLGAHAAEIPKWLLQVGDRTIADRQLEGIARAGDAVASVRVVVGHAAHVIEAEIAGRDAEIGVVMNPEFAELNNWWSVLRALREIPEGEPVAIINSDLFVEADAVSGFLTAMAEGADEGALAIDLERELTDESMKVSQSPSGVLERIGKVDIDAPVGEYVGMMMARGDVRARFTEVLEGFVDRPEAVNEWYEGAVGRTAADGVDWQIWPMPTGAWVEIDDDGDLGLAEGLVSA